MTHWTASVDASGQFRLAIGDLQPGPYELRLQVCHTNGAASGATFAYRVDSLGVPDLKPFSAWPLHLQRAVAAYANGQKQQVLALARDLETEAAGDAAGLRQLNHLRALLQPDPPQALASLPPEQKNVLVSRLRFSEQTVGWGRPLRDQVLVRDGSTCFLQVGGQFFERGLFAHAPSLYAVELSAGWKRLSTRYGVQDGNQGSVVFVIRGDGRELFRSRLITDHRLRAAEVDLSGVNRLELVVEDGGNGGTSDWGVWISPTLER